MKSLALLDYEAATLPPYHKSTKWIYIVEKTSFKERGFFIVAEA